MKETYRPVFLGIFMGLLTLLVAEFMASGFGVFEKDIKGALLIEALEHTEGVTVEGHEHEEDLHRKVFQDRDEAKKVAAKAWVYLKRAHSHGEGLGVIIIAMSLLLGHTLLKSVYKRILCLMIGVGGFIYPFCWFYAGTFMVDVGKEVAKSDVHWVAISSVSLYLGGLIGVLGLLLLNYLNENWKLVRFFFEEQKG